MTFPERALRQQGAVRFQDQSVVDRYHLRPTYPPDVFTRLRDLISDEPRAVLDVGCGPGPLARGLLDVAERIDAVDLSPQMLALARTLPGGQSPNMRWLLGRAEEVALDPPYALITAGRSLHWMDWKVALPRFARLLTPQGVLAIVHTRELPSPWSQPLRELSQRYTARTGGGHRDMIEQLEQAHLFQRWGEYTTAPLTQYLTIEEHIGRHHSRSSFSLDQIPREQAERFSAEARALLSPFANQEILTQEIVGQIVWGKPPSG